MKLEWVLERDRSVLARLKYDKPKFMRTVKQLAVLARLEYDKPRFI